MTHPKPTAPEKARPRAIRPKCVTCKQPYSDHEHLNVNAGGILVRVLPACERYTPKQTAIRRSSPIPRKAVPKRTKRPNKVRKTGRAALARLADKLCGQIVRARGKCEVCGAGPAAVLQWAHLFSRRYHAIRWNLLNGACLCRADHFRFGLRPLEWDVWMREALGQPVYDELRRLALKNERVDLVATVEYLRAELAKVA